MRSNYLCMTNDVAVMKGGLWVKMEEASQEAV